MLVVISIIMILAGMILPTLSGARREGRIANCMSNLHQIGIALHLYAKDHGDGNPDAYPPWLTLLLTSGGKNPYLPDPRVLYCPEDGSSGKDGGRPSRLKTHYDGEGVQPIRQFEMADVDPHSGPLNGQGPKNSEDGGANCSYLFEYCGEPCDWIYSGGPPVSSSDLPGVPAEDEWRWEGDAPDASTFRDMVDRDGSGVLSWNEVKVFTRRGCNYFDEDAGKTYRMRGWDIRVPIVRCYWHISGELMTDSSEVLNLRGDGSAVDRGVLRWYLD
jgi:type II secretory pathway pseudopilin PulG